MWQPEHQPGLYSIPDSSAWIRGLAGATRFAFVPDSAGALAEQVEFDLRVVGPWRDAIERCRGMKPPPTDPRSESTTGRSPAYGEYIYVEEFPEAISKVSPHYPDALRGTGREGTVVVQALVNKEGRIVDTKIARSNPDFDAAAEEAVRQYRFKPARAKGQPVAVWIAVPIRFVTD